jgi:hypothetical protein
MLKKIFFSLILCSTIFASSPAMAENYTIVAQNPIGTEEITEFLQGIMAHMQSIIAFLAVLFIIIGGVLYITAAGNPGRVTAAKICWTGALIGIAIAAAAPTFLKEIKNIALRDGNMPETLDEALTVKEIVINTVNFLLSIFGILSIIGLVVSGVIYLVSFGNPQMKENAKKGVAYSIAGIAIAGAAVVLVRQIIVLITG